MKVVYEIVVITGVFDGRGWWKKSVLVEGGDAQGRWIQEGSRSGGCWQTLRNRFSARGRASTVLQAAMAKTDGRRPTARNVSLSLASRPYQ